MDLMTFLERFPDQAACFAHLEATRWPKGPVCPQCGVVNDALRLPSRDGYWFCRSCRNQFSVTIGTPMESTHLALRTWFGAIFLMATSSKGVSAMVLSRQLELGYKTAWFLAHRIGNLMPQDWRALRGLVEVDERYLGGKRKTGRTSRRDPDDDQPVGRAGQRKSMVMVGVERGGRAKARRGGTHSERTVAGFVDDNVDRSSVLLTDDLPAYRWIGQTFPARLAVNHSRGEYVRRDPLAATTAQVNTAESFNAILKRCWIGVHHWWSIKHSHRYLSQRVFHWNHRKTDTAGRLANLFQANRERLRFQDCIA